jgi:hypothetical protein
MADAYIPRFRAIREAVGGTYDPDRRPGSSGQRYFSDVEYANPNMPQRIFDPEAEGYETQAAYDARFDTAMDTATDAARDVTRQQASGLQALNLSNLARQERPATFLPPAETPAGIATVTPNQTTGVQRLYDLLAQYIQGTQIQPYGYGEETQMMAQGGLASVAPKGMYLGGSTDGMADQIPATIDNRQPAALSDGEFVVPADVVSHLGNGNSDAGAKQLYGMMDRIRKARTGSTEQGKQINPNKFLA